MKKQKSGYSQEEERCLLTRLLIHCPDRPSEIGLFHGMIGYAIAIADYSRFRRMRFLEAVADMLVEKALGRITTVTPVGLADGLAGIGWGIEYLISKGFIKGDGSDILPDLDRKLMLTDISRFEDNSTEEGLKGILHYVAFHVSNARKNGRTVFDERYLASLRERAKSSDDREIKNLVKNIDGDAEYSHKILNFVAKDSLNENSLSLVDGISGILETIIMEPTAP